MAAVKVGRGAPRPARLERVAAIGLAVTVLATSPALGAGESPPGATVDELLVLARRLSPELAARALESDAAAARVEAAGALEDPVLTVTSDEERDERGRRLNEMVYGIEQEVPLWGKRDLRRRVAAAEAAGAKARERLALLELEARIKTTFAAYWRASHALSIRDEVHALLQAVLGAAQGRYAQGLGSQADAIRAGVELSRLALERWRLERDRRTAAARLNALLARPGGAVLAQPVALRPVPDEARLAPEELLARARERSPLAEAADAEIAAAEGDRRLVERSWYPDVTLGAAAIQREDGPEGYMLSAGLRLPLQWGLRRTQAREATAKLNAARARREGALLELQGALGEGLAGLSAARRASATLAGDLTPQAAAAYQSAVTAYQLGRGDLTAVLEAARNVQEVQLERLAAEEEAQAALADIERVIGGEL
jgi:outer membrane protein, heavy metal efflux system